MATILVALEHAARGAALLDWAGRLAAGLRAELLLLHVLPPRALQAALLDVAHEARRRPGDGDHPAAAQRPLLPGEAALAGLPGWYREAMDELSALSDAWQAREQLATQILADAARRAARAGAGRVTCQVQAGEPTATIARVAAACDADLLLLGAEPRETLLPGVDSGRLRQLLDLTRRPCLVVPDPDRAPGVAMPEGLAAAEVGP